jgi:hypothetical protein
MYKKIQKILINVFIIFNLMLMLRAQINDTKPMAKFFYTPANHVQNYFSMWRGWKMFAPNPLRTNSWVEARVVVDGEDLKYSFPGPQSGSIEERYLIGERFRKYIVEGVRLDKNKHLWEDAARYVLNKYLAEFPDSKVEEIRLIRKWREIPKWDHMFIDHGTKSNIKFSYFTFYTYKVNGDEV